jgi:hypothetical protein
MPGDDSESKALIEAAKVVAPKLYEDAIQPAAKQIGQALETIGRLANVAISPALFAAYSGEHVVDFLMKRLKSKLEAIPPDERQAPQTSVLGPALEAIRFKGDEVEVQELFANLLASDMDKRAAKRILPAFVEIIRQLSPDEARILRVLQKHRRHFPVVHIEYTSFGKTVIAAWNLSLLGLEAGCGYPNLIQSYLDNLSRLGIIQFLPKGEMYLSESYREVEAYPDYVALKNVYRSRLW